MIIGALAGAAAANVIKHVGDAIAGPAPRADPRADTLPDLARPAPGRAAAKLGHDAEALLLQGQQDTSAAASGLPPGSARHQRGHAAYAQVAR